MPTQGQITNTIEVRVQGNEQLQALLTQLRQLQQEVSRATGRPAVPQLPTPMARDVVGLGGGYAGLPAQEARLLAYRGVMTGRVGEGQAPIQSQVRVALAQEMVGALSGQLTAAREAQAVSLEAQGAYGVAAGVRSGAIQPGDPTAGMPGGPGAADPRTQRLPAALRPQRPSGPTGPAQWRAWGAEREAELMGRSRGGGPGMLGYQLYFGLMFGGLSEWQQNYASGQPTHWQTFLPALGGGMGAAIGGAMGGPGGAMMGMLAGQTFGDVIRATWERSQTYNEAASQLGWVVPRTWGGYRTREDAQAQGRGTIVPTAPTWGAVQYAESMARRIGRGTGGGRDPVTGLDVMQTALQVGGAMQSIGAGGDVGRAWDLTERVRRAYGAGAPGEAAGKSLAGLISDPRYGTAILGAMQGEQFRWDPRAARAGAMARYEELAAGLPGAGGRASVVGATAGVLNYAIIAKMVGDAGRQAGRVGAGVDVYGIAAGAVWENRPWTQVETLVRTFAPGQDEYRRTIERLGGLRTRISLEDERYAEAASPLDIGIYAGSKLMGTRLNMRQMLTARYGQVAGEYQRYAREEQQVAPGLRRALRERKEESLRQMVDIRAQLERGWQERLISQTLGAPTGFRAQILEGFNYAGAAGAMESAGGPGANRYFGTWGGAGGIGGVGLPESGMSVASMEPANAFAQAMGGGAVNVNVNVNGMTVEQLGPMIASEVQRLVESTSRRANATAPVPRVS
ncbi:MAG: hypothetical protein A2V88_17725 [Elusimicrobia bacterium RBG_16_66_12]|nr:MAG: hypothetical protein A2V88_17725 [Elusimicrobia bacterium RBG_16_66_12]